MAPRLLACLLFLLPILDTVYMDLISSTSHLTTMLEVEKQLTNKMESYLVTAKQRLTILEQLYADFDQLWPAETDNSTQSRGVGCPLPAPSDRPSTPEHTGDWDKLARLAAWNPFDEVVDSLGATWITHVPDPDSLDRSLQSIVRLIDVYQLDLRALTSRGEIYGVSGARLDAEDCRNLAISALNMGKFDLAGRLLDVAVELDSTEEWVREVAKLRRLNEYGRTEMERPEEFGYIDENGESLDDEVEVDDITMADLELRFSWSLNISSDDDDPDRLTSWVETVQTYDPDEGFQIPDGEAPATREYQALCRGERMEVDDSLVCSYRSVGVSYNRWRTEMMKRDPQIIMFHNFVSDGEAEAIREAAMPMMRRAKVITTDGKGFSKTRVGKTAWVDNADIDYFANQLNARVSAVTSLDAGYYAEHLQVAVYGLGGMYEPHNDYNRASFKYGLTEGRRIGDRLATFMIYNAAIFWYNQYRDGTSDPTTLHAGCPILLGHKWVANKWIHEYGQEFRYPCPLQMDSPEAHRIPDREREMYSRNDMVTEQS